MPLFRWTYGNPNLVDVCEQDIGNLKLEDVWQQLMHVDRKPNIVKQQIRKPNLVDDVWEHPAEVAGKLHLVDIAKHEPLKLRIHMCLILMWKLLKRSHGHNLQLVPRIFSTLTLMRSCGKIIAISW